MEAAVEQEWFSAQEFARKIGSDPDDVRKRIKAGLLAGGHMMPPLTGTRPSYKVHYPTFLASLPGHEETNEA